MATVAAAMPENSRARSAAVTVLVIPAASAARSSMPRPVWLPVAPAARHASATAGSPTSARSRLVARLLERTIIRRASQWTGAAPPSRSHTSCSLS